MSSAPTEPAPWSLRGRLIKLFAAGGGVAWLVSGALIMGIAEREDDGDWDVALESSARVILRLAHNEFEAADPGLKDFQGRVPLALPGSMLQIRNGGGDLLLKTADAPEAPLVTADSGFHNVHLAGGDWRVTVLRDPDTGLVLQLADSERRRNGEFAQLAVALLVPIIVGLPVLMLGAWFLATRALSPLRRSARHMSERSSSDLSPIGAGELPQEVLPLVAAFNHLLGQLAEAGEDERRFAAGVAHELRTPLAGIRLNLQRLQREPTGPGVPAKLDLIIGAVDRAGRVIEQLLTLTRLERNLARERVAEPLELQRVIDETIGEFAARASERGIRFEVAAELPLVHAPAQAFYLVLRNFVENAVRHSPRGAAIRVSAGAGNTQWWLQVEDAGSGLTPPASATADSRLPTEKLQIGLSLVRKIAELLDGRLESGRSALLGGASFRFSAPLDEPETVDDLAVSSDA